LFAKHDDVAYNYGSGLFETKEVHKIGILDIRILNADRNDENILLREKEGHEGKKRFELIPIDHGLSLPDRFIICRDDVVWMFWNQSKEAFS